MGWIGCIRYEKFRSDFVARTLALVRPVLHRFSLGNQTVRNPPKLYESHQNISLESSGSGTFVAKNSDTTSFSNFCTSSARLAPRFVWQPNGPKCTQIVRIAPKHKFMVQWSGSGAFVAKNCNANSSHELLH